MQSNYRAYNGMNCSSVRYAATQLARRVERQRRYPNPNMRFSDGYVTWHCSNRGGFTVTCRENTSGTMFRVRFAVYYH